MLGCCKINVKLYEDRFWLSLFTNDFKWLLERKMCRMIKAILDEQQLKAVCDVLAETKLVYTKSELTRLLKQSGIEIVSDGKTSSVKHLQLWVLGTRYKPTQESFFIGKRSSRIR